MYALDYDENLLTFDLAVSEAGGDPFTVLGKLNCDKGAPLPGRDLFAYSMTSDRKGNVWISYSNGELFKADVATLSCTKTNWRGVSDMDQILMSFAGPTTQPERLFMMINRADSATPAQYAEVDPTTLEIVASFPLTNQEGYTPNLAGTSDGKMLTYEPRADKGVLSSVELTTGHDLETWDMAELGTNSLSFWAFAVYGGKALFFTTVQSATGRRTFKVSSFDPRQPAGQQFTLLNPDSPREILVAGASTCAPPWGD